MKKSLICITSLCLSLSLTAQPLSHRAPQETMATYLKDATTGLYFVENENNTAKIVTNQETRNNGTQKPYSTTPMVIPEYFTITVSGLSGSSDVKLNIVELGKNALMNATFTSLSFAEPSHITTFRTGALKDTKKIKGTLTLPSSLQLIETEGIYGSATDLTKLILPASLDSLALSSITLPLLDTIVFLGTTPPACAIDGTKNPWVGTISTPDSIVVIVPEGAENAYKNTKGIGDYFTCFKGIITAIGDIETMDTNDKDAHNGSTAHKYIRDGQLIIERDGIRYDALGKAIQ